MRKLLTAIAITATLLVSACAGGFSLSALSPTQLQTARIATKLGVQVGILQYVGEDVQRAQRVKNGAETVKGFLEDDTTVDLYKVQHTVNELIDEFVADKFKSPQQVLLLKNAVTLVVVDIEAIIREQGGAPGVLTPELKERVNFYLDAVIEAVSLVIGPQPTAELAFGIDRVV